MKINPFVGMSEAEKQQIAEGILTQQIMVEEQKAVAHEDQRYESAQAKIAIAALKKKAKLLRNDEYRDAKKDLLRAKIDDVKDLAEAEEGAKVKARRDENREKQRHERNMQIEKYKALGTMLTQVGGGLKNFLGDKKRIAILCTAVVGVSGGVKLLSMALRFLERVLKRPVLIRETSNKTFLQKLFPKKHDSKVPKLDDLILKPSLKKRLHRVAQATIFAKQYGAPLPGVLLYGPPGNGKTMFMRALAAESGMNFAMISGGDVSALLSSGGKNVAVTELHKMFDWAIHHGPTLLFIDEASALFRGGRGVNLSEGLSAAQEAILSRTGGSSTSIQLVCSSNLVEILDDAIKSRLSEKILLPNPGPEERTQMLLQFFKEMSDVGIGTLNVPVKVLDEVKDQAFIAEIVRMTENYSGRDMTMKLFDAAQRSMLADNDLTINQKMLMDIVNQNKQTAAEIAGYKYGEPVQGVK
jgi:ATPase family AAA domain-containing protein 3A/B